MLSTLQGMEGESVLCDDISQLHFELKLITATSRVLTRQFRTIMKRGS